MKILITDKFDEEALKYLEDQKVEITYQPEISTSSFLSQVAGYDALIVRSRTKVTKEVIDKGKNLKIIARAGSGVDNIDIEAAKEKNIAVINAAGANAQAVAELTIGLMLSLIRKIPYADLSLRHGKWQKKELEGAEIYGKTVGIVGFGHVGKKVASLVRAFGANVITYDKNDDEERLRKLLLRSDFVCLHLRLNDSTYGFINKEKLAMMKKSAYLINNSRGEIVVEDDLFQALRQGVIAGAALDVFWQEPMPKDSRWFKLSNLILTPHIGGQTKEASRKACMMVAIDVVKFFKGEVVNSRVV